MMQLTFEVGVNGHRARVMFWTMPRLPELSWFSGEWRWVDDDHEARHGYISFWFLMLSLTIGHWWDD